MGGILETLKSDDERVTFAQEQFQNSVRSDPGRNMTLQSFKFYKKTKHTKNVSRENFVINLGKLQPLSYYLKESDNASNQSKNINYSDFVASMNYEEKFASKFLSPETLKKVEAGQEETANFLSF